MLPRGPNEIARTNAGLPSVELTTAAKAFIGDSLRPNTRRAYKAQGGKYIAWCEAAGHHPWSGDPAQVAGYLAHMAQQGGRDGSGAAMSTIRTALAAIKFGHDAVGVAFTSTAPVITKTLRGVTNSKPRIAKQAEPMRAVDVIDAMNVCGPSNAGRRDAAVIAIGYLFALRRSELVALDLENLGSGDGVIMISATAIELTLARAKTGDNQIVTVPREANVDAVRAIEDWIAAADIRPGDALFTRVNKSDRIGDQRVTAQSVGIIIKRRVAEHHMALGVSEQMAKEVAAEFSGHSLRVGFATTAAEAGADLRSIASVTRHKSLEMPRRYAQRADQLRTSPHNLDGVGISRVHL